MPDKLVISIDAMGGDQGPPVVIPAVKKALEKNPDVAIILVGDQTVLTPLLKKQHLTLSDRLTLHHTPEMIRMDELPSQALRTKKQSSMRLAIELVKEGTAQACVSAGNTGALVAISKFVLGMIPGVHRPAIISAIPTMGKNYVHMLDLGANVDSSAEQLCQFAVMGAVLKRYADNIPHPRVGLLNVGQEQIKGNAQVKEAHERLSQLKSIHYIGFVEGDDTYKGNVDVVVCDGFVGNAVLKASEGVAKLVTFRIKEAFEQNFLTKLCALISLPVMRIVKSKLDSSHYNGASLLGLQGIVIKSHGGANVYGYSQAIQKAIAEARGQVPLHIQEEVAQLLNQTSASAA